MVFDRYKEDELVNSCALSLISYILRISLTDGRLLGSFSRSWVIKSYRSCEYLFEMGAGFSYTILNTRPRRLSAENAC